MDRARKIWWQPSDPALAPAATPLARRSGNLSKNASVTRRISSTGQAQAPSSSIYGRPTGGSYWNRESRIRRFQSSVSAPLARGTKEGNYDIFRTAGNMESLDEC